MQTISKATFSDILAAIRANNNSVIDDHDRDDAMRRVSAIAQHGDNTVLMLTQKETAYFCVNPLYLDENGVPHLSRWSCGGTIDMRRMALEQAVAHYNDPDSWMPGFQKATIEQLTYL